MTTLSDSAAMFLKGQVRTALQHRRACRFYVAEQLYRKIVGVQPSCLEAWYGLALVALQLEKFKTAENVLSALVDAHRDRAEPWEALGRLRQAQDRNPEALQCLRRAVALKPDWADAHARLGVVLVQCGQSEEALVSFQAALDLKPGHLEAEANLANTLGKVGQPSPIDPNKQFQLNRDLAAQLRREGDLRGSVRHLRLARDLNPTSADTRYDLGVSLEGLGLKDEALDELETARGLDRSNGHIHYALGQAYQSQGRLADAASAFREALRALNPRYANAPENRPDDTQEFPPEPPPAAEISLGGQQYPAIPPVDESKGNRPFWSVVIPALNRKAYILECLASVLAEWPGEDEMEIIVVDNGSDPPMRELVDSIGGGVVRYFHRPETIDLQKNWNSCVALTRGQWVHLLHDDDYVLPDFYSRLEAGLRTCPETVGAAFCGYENIDERGRTILANQIYGEYRGVAPDWISQIGVSCVLNPPAVVVRRAAYEKLGGYSHEILCATDWELYKRIASFYDWWYEPDVLARYREHSQSITRELNEAGSRGPAIRRSIEMSETYLPRKISKQVTERARRNQFGWCMARLNVPVQAGNPSGAVQLMQEALRIDHSEESVTELFTWLSKDEAAPVRRVLLPRLRALPAFSKALRKNRSNLAVADLFNWLATGSAAALRMDIATRLIETQREET